LRLSLLALAFVLLIPAGPAVAAHRCDSTRLVVGTKGDDRLTGSSLADPIYAQAGDDVIRGLAGDDCIFAMAGNDRVNAGPGNDRVDGGAGADFLRGGSGRDRIFGRAGNDTIDASDRDHDTVDCGPGRDTVIVRRGDKLTGCERVRVKH
jgi:Ca2+-binding RTX toxin-like protein